MAMISVAIILLFCAAVTWAWGQVFKHFAIPLYLSFVASSITCVLVFLSLMLGLHTQDGGEVLNNGFWSMIGTIAFYALPMLLLMSGLSAYAFGHFKR